MAGDVAGRASGEESGDDGGAEGTGAAGDDDVATGEVDRG
jgi:hypothetical protein